MLPWKQSPPWLEVRETLLGSAGFDRCLEYLCSFAQEYEARWLSRLHYYPKKGTDPDGSPSWALHWALATQHSSGLGYRSDGTFWGND